MSSLPLDRRPAAGTRRRRPGFGLTWWGDAWVTALEQRARLDSNRLPRGRSYARGGTGLNLTAASHVVLYDRWWNPAVEDQARDRAWRIGQTRTVVSHRLVCPGTVDERVEEVVAGKRHIADLVLPKSSSLSDLDADQLRVALGLRPDSLLTEDEIASRGEEVPA